MSPERICRRFAGRRKFPDVLSAAVSWRLWTRKPLKQHRHTAVQRTGRWDGFRQLMFGKDVSYPSTLEDLYTVPEVEMTDTCDGIDCQVLGVFGDACSVNVVLEFSGVNGFTLPENVQLFGESPWISGDGVGGWKGSIDYTYDASTAEIDGQPVCDQSL